MNAVARPRLYAVLDRWPDYRVIVIRAAAGYGKSSLVATWLAQRPAAAPAVAWLSLDAEDGDPVSFVHYLAAAVDRVVPGALAAVEPVLDDIIPSPTRAMVELLGAIERGGAAAANRSPLLVAFDDYHRVNSADIDALLTTALERAPDHIHFLILSRSMPSISLARLAVSGSLRELTTDDLRFDRIELSQFMDGYVHQRLLAEQVDLLLNRTEGWIAGLKLAALSVAHQDDPMAILGELHGKGRWQADYLTSEVLANQTPNIRRFLLSTSILDQFNTSLSLAVSGQEEGAQLLAGDDCERLFLIPLDNQRSWFRYHHLFQQLLQLHLGSTFSADEIRELHRRAAAWHVANGDGDVAVSHFLEAGETDAAAVLLEQLINQALDEHDLHQADTRFALLSAEELDRRPKLLLLMCKLSIIRSEPALIANVARAERALARWGKDAPERPGLEAQLSVYQAVAAFHQRRIDDLRDSIRRAGQLESLLDDNTRAILRLMQFHESSMTYHWDAAHQFALQALADYVQDNSTSGMIYTRQELAVMLMHTGRGAEAARELERIIDDFPRPQPNIILRDLQYTHLQLAEVCYWLDDLARFRLHARESAKLGTQLGDEFLLNIAAQLVDIHNLADPEHADLGLRRPRPMSVDEGGEFYFNIELEVLYQTLLGRVDQAQVFLTLMDLSPASDPHTLAPSRLVVFAQAYVAVGRDLPAIDHLMEHGLNRLRRAGALYFLGRLQAIEAWRQLKLGKAEAARRSLKQAVRTAAATGFRRPILNITDFVTLLPDIRHPLAEQLHNQMLASMQGAPLGVVEQLTPREREVLLLLANDYRYQDIADELVVSLQTVRGHVQRIYRKLGVTRRLAALDMARRAGLID